jgi:hypothetical protein
MFRQGFNRFFEADSGAGSGGAPATGGDSAQKDTGAPAGAENTEKGPIPYERFKAVNDEAAELRKWRKEREAADKAAEKKAADAEAARLAEQGKFKELAEAAEKKASDLEPFKTKAERAEAALTKLLEEERKGLPKHVTELLDKLDPVDQLEYIAKNREALGAKPAPPNINAGDGAGNKNAAAADDAEKARIAAKFGVDPRYIR